MHTLLLTTYFEPDSGAAAVRLSRLAHQLHARGHRVTVLAAMPHYPQGRIHRDYAGRFFMSQDHDGVSVIRSWLWATGSPRISRKLISQNTFMLTAALRGLFISRPDVMLIEAQPVFTSFAGFALSFVRRIPYVLNVSDLWPDHLLSVGALSEHSLSYRAARHLVNMTYRRAAAITSLSPAWSEIIQSYTDQPGKIHTIYNGVDLARFSPTVDGQLFRQKYGLHTPNIVTFIGTFATQYDFSAMFAVAERLADREDTAFVFIGSGSQAADVVAYARRQSNVRYIDWIDHEEIPAAWAASTLTYWAMRDEPLYHGTIPAKLYEIFASGVPLAAAHDGITARIIDQAGAGIVVPSSDVDGLTRAVERLLNDPAYRQACAHQARAYAEANFDPQRVTEAYENVLLSAFRR